MDELNYNGFSNEGNEINTFQQANNANSENIVDSAAQNMSENVNESAVQNVLNNVSENAAQDVFENVIENVTEGVNERVIENEKAYEGSPVDLRSASYYSESYTKPKKRKNGILMQMILVAVMSSILGGSIVGGFFIFGVPALGLRFNPYSKTIPTCKGAWITPGRIRIFTGRWLLRIQILL